MLQYTYMRIRGVFPHVIPFNNICDKRSYLGKHTSKRLRYNGVIPGVIYGKNLGILYEISFLSFMLFLRF